MDKERKDESIPGWFWLFGSLIIVCWVAAWFLPACYLNGWGARGQFGDTFGSVNALFSGFAFLGVILALYFQRQDLKIQSEALRMQNEELQLQRKELEQTREEIKGQREEMSLQRESMQKQQFEATFFQLLRLFDESRQRIYRNNKVGVAALDEYVAIFRNHLSSEVKSRPGRLDNKRLGEIFENFTPRWGDTIVPYCRHFGVLCRMVEDAKVEQKSAYWDIIRDILAPTDAVLLFCYCSSNEDHRDLKLITEKNRLLRYMVNHEWGASLPRETWSPAAFK